MKNFTEEQILDIVSRYTLGETISSIAKSYNTYNQKISLLLKNNCATYKQGKRDSKQFITPFTTKICPKCGRDLPLSAYCLGNGKYGKRSICKDCDHKIHNTDEYRLRRKIIRDKKRKEDSDYWRKEREKDNETLLKNENSYKKYMIRSAKQRAKTKNILFDISYSDFSIPEYCPLLGIKLIKHIGQKEKQDNSPSLDRIIPSLGYVKGNVWVISERANRIKSNASVEELELLVKNLKLFLRK